MYKCISKVVECTQLLAAFVERVYVTEIRVVLLEFIEDGLDCGEVLVIRGKEL